MNGKESGGTVTWEPPADRLYQYLLQQAVSGDLETYGVVVEYDKVTLKRAFDHHRPDKSEEGHALLVEMSKAWNAGMPTQPWLYVWEGEYIVADDYFWVALMEIGSPDTFAAQVLGEPLEAGLRQKVGPLSVDHIERLLGIVR